MSDDYVSQLPMWRWLQDRYPDTRSTQFPSGGKTDYLAVFMGTHSYLNEKVHPTVQQRAPLTDAGVYLTDHGPRHIQLVMHRASQMLRTKASAASEGAVGSIYAPCVGPYEVFLLALAIHFHDVGNMYGRAGHEERILEVMKNIGPLQALEWHQRHLIAQIAASHGGRIEGDKDTIRRLADGRQDDGGVSYRPQLLAAVLRFADELADEWSRADGFGLLSPEKLPPTCLLYHKYAQGLRVSMGKSDGRIGLNFNLRADDLRAPFSKMTGAGSTVDVFLLDEIYERTLKTYNEARYCGRFLGALEIQPSEVAVKIDIFETQDDYTPIKTIAYVIGDSHYPTSTTADLPTLARGFDGAPTGIVLAGTLPPKKE